MSTYRITRLTIKNVGAIEDADIALDGVPLAIFYGDIRQGKTTILNAVRWVMGGSVPEDIIRHGANEASIRLEFSGGFVARSWYRSAKDGATTARAVEFVRDGKPVKRPVDALRELLNPFQLRQTFFADMGESERRKFMAELFGVTDAAADAALTMAESKARELRAVVGAFGEIDLREPPGASNAASVREQIRRAELDWQQACEAINEQNSTIRSVNDEIEEGNRKMREWESDRIALLERVAELDINIAAGREWLAQAGEPQPEIQQPPRPDLSAFHRQLEQAAAAEAMRAQYEKNVAEKARQDAKRTELSQVEDTIKSLRKAKTDALAKLSDASGVPGLVFKDGGFEFEGVDAGMLSTSQVMRLSEEMSALYPDGFGLSLIDRGESLGKSVFGLIDRATTEEKSILVTVVGEPPAKIPEHVGVFVVENGAVSAKE